MEKFQNQTPFLMPGPQFGQPDLNQSWFKRHSQKIILGAIVVLIFLGGYYFYKNYQEKRTLTKSALENITLTPSPAATQSPKPTQFKSADNTQKVVLGENTSAAANATPSIPSLISKTGENITVKAAKGNGTTHLARSALKEYLKDNPDVAKKLKAEQKIYIEDYLRKNVTDLPKVLKINDEISFSVDLIKIAIDQSQKLSDKEINNLSKYVPLVPSINY